VLAIRTLKHHMGLAAAAAARRRARQGAVVSEERRGFGQTPKEVHTERKPRTPPRVGGTSVRAEYCTMRRCQYDALSAWFS
jgi:hypothetical protein